MASSTSTVTTSTSPTPSTASLDGAVTAGDLPDWPVSYTGSRTGPFFKGGVDHWQYVWACLTDLGYAVSLRDDGRGLTVPEQISQRTLGQASQACWQKAIDIGLVVDPPFSEAYLTVMYHAYTWLTQCLLDHGVPAPDPPSLDAFLEGGLDSWNPYAGFPAGAEVGLGVEGMYIPADIADQLAIQADCPIHTSDLLSKVGITPSDIANLPSP
ncbi:MAG: hypothetical protein GXP34_07990 [Actinobacteria bacterium]|nr:hypothetical protein [Actinomycetota bacterium]